MCHFIVDHMYDLDATVVNLDSGDRLMRKRAPWEIRPTLKADLLEAWQRYPQDPHDA
jgi:hypothetical protein